ncbi:hypothetical protein JMJ77_0002362, partial [Colletotrichum scovillei]
MYLRHDCSKTLVQDCRSIKSPNCRWMIRDIPRMVRVVTLTREGFGNFGKRSPISHQKKINLTKK